MVYTSTGSAAASGQIVLDETLLPNPGNTSSLSVIQSLTLTVSGASSGNGTFTLSDFGSFAWNTGGGTLNLSTNLVGQTVGASHWGPVGVGDFNFFNSISSPSAPNGVGPFTLGTNGGAGDILTLSSLTPAVVPEPSTWSLMLAGVLGVVWFQRRRRYSR